MDMSSFAVGDDELGDERVIPARVDKHPSDQPVGPMPQRLALSPDEAAAAIGCSRDFLDEHIAPELRWVRRGRRKFVSVRELEAWLERSAALTLELDR
jgi:hypothetical protein